MKKKELIEELGRFPFTKVVFEFGSSASGKKTPISDIDICVIDDESFPKDKRREVYQYSEKPFDISLFSDLPLYIKYEVLKGKAVVV